MNDLKSTNSLTSLRFIAAYLVVGFHFFSFNGSFKFLNIIFQRGYLGVDFFFILSGFVLGLRYNKEAQLGSFNSSKFWKLRLLRIAPSYYLSLILGLIVLIKAFQSSDFLSTPLNKAAFILSNLTFTQSILPTLSLIENWNVPAWSVSVEFFFYLSFPFISIPILKQKQTSLLLIICFMLCVFLYFLNSYLPTNIMLLNYPTKVSWTNSFFFRLPEFILGNLLSSLFFKKSGSDFKLQGLILSLLLILALFTLPLPNMVLEGGHPVVIITFSLFIYFVALNDTGKGLLHHPWLLFMGEASYVLYICQAPLKLYFQQFYSKILHAGPTTGLLYVFYLSICLLGSSALIYKYFEQPLVQYYRKKIS